MDWGKKKKKIMIIENLMKTKPKYVVAEWSIEIGLEAIVKSDFLINFEKVFEIITQIRTNCGGWELSED
jgi:hypothetical protein